MIRKLLDLVGDLLGVELETSAGQLNLTLMAMSAFVVLATTITPVFEAVVRIFKSDYSTGTPWVQVFIAWGALNLLCILMIGMLEKGAAKRR